MADTLARNFPENLDVQLHLGSWHAQSGRDRQADVHFDKALALDPHNPAARRAVGIACIERGDLDDTLFGNVDVAIADFQSITYMKVQAKIRTAGEWVTEESLNAPGQKFTGEVKDNLVEGVFEIEHERYDGTDAPPFPPEFRENEDLKEFLEPEDMIESNDPVLVEEAREITKGSKDSWEAARRLSKWAAEQIGYSIPGGSARHTFDTR